MDKIYMIDKDLMRKIINTLKSLDVRGWDSMDALVGVVMILEQGMNPPPAEEKTETIEVDK